VDSPPKKLWVYFDYRAGIRGEWKSTSVQPGPWAGLVHGPYTVQPKKRKAPPKRSVERG
jgi:hypothetical protein